MKLYHQVPIIDLTRLVLRPRHKWFSAESRDSEGWDGPHKTFEGAARAAYANAGWDSPNAVFVTQGYKMTKREKEDMGAEHDWQCDTPNAVEVRL